MDQNEVNTAFEILLEEIEEVFNNLDKEIQNFAKNRDFNKVKDLSETGNSLKEFREKVKTPDFNGLIPHIG